MSNAENKKIKVVVAMSGGVDSSVSAALLKKAGFEVVGLFMKLWSPESSSLKENKCCSSESQNTSRLVAEKLKIPFYVVNFEKEFKKTVVDSFLRDHKNGVTPNPCVICNEKIKFGLLLRKARLMGADYIATGHYAIIKQDKKIGFRLFNSADKDKDQSYFLWRLKQDQLKYVMFPVGKYKKEEVRKMAKKFGLPSAQRKESQEICFVPETLKEFLAVYLKNKPGVIMDVKEKVLGKHSGLWFYTIGQRKGIKLSNGPYYVVAKDLEKNSLIVSKDKKDLLKKELVAEDVNWLARKLETGITVKAKTRYGSSRKEANIFHIGKNKIKVVFKKPQKAITPGQSAVFYKGKELLGGGIISKI